MLRDRFFITLLFVLCAVTVLHLLGITFFFYWRFAWLDIVAHLAGGFWAGGMALWILDRFGFEQTRPAVSLLLAVFVGFIIGAWWEIFEVMIGASLVELEEYVPDTIADFLFDMSGAFFAGLYFLKIRSDKFAIIKSKNTKKTF